MVMRSVFHAAAALLLIGGALGCSQTFRMNLDPTAIQPKAATGLIPVRLVFANMPVDSFVYVKAPIGKRKLEMKNLHGALDEMLKKQIEQVVKNHGFAIAPAGQAARAVLTVDFATFELIWHAGAFTSQYGQSMMLIKHTLAPERKSAVPAWTWNFQEDATHGSMWGNCQLNACAFVSGLTIIGAIPFLIYLKNRKEAYDYLTELGNRQLKDYLKKLDAALPLAGSMRGKL